MPGCLATDHTIEMSACLGELPALDDGHVIIIRSRPLDGIEPAIGGYREARGVFRRLEGRRDARLVVTEDGPVNTSDVDGSIKKVADEARDRLVRDPPFRCSARL